MPTDSSDTVSQDWIILLVEAAAVILPGAILSTGGT